jgi:Na+/H+ antiporter NhaC
MRPMTDELRISREKLAYIVDSVAAPIAVIAPISTWVGFEISRIGDSLRPPLRRRRTRRCRPSCWRVRANPFNVFLHSIPYLFYPIFAMMLVLMIAITGREFGPMHAAERGRRPAVACTGRARGWRRTWTAPWRARPDVPRRWYNALIPIVTVVLVALIALYTTGRAGAGRRGATIRNIIGEADPFRSLLWASFAGGLVAGCWRWRSAS